MFRLFLVLACGAVGGVLFNAYVRSQDVASQTSAATVATEGEMIPSQDLGEWFERMFRASRPDPERPNRLGSRGPDDASISPWPTEPRDREKTKPQAGAFRTLCVRLCDGYYFPISYAIQRERFARDAKQCEQSCPGARLYVHRNPGEEADDMVDLEGRSYRKLPTAFLYRTDYLADCTCRGNPWDETALAKHREYAAAAQRAGQAKAAGTTKPKRSSRTSWARSNEDRSRKSAKFGEVAKD